MADDAEIYLQRTLDWLQRRAHLRKAIAAVAVIALLGLAGKFVYDLMPRQYALSITGGSLLGSRHYLAKILEEEATQKGVSLKIVPTGGSVEALETMQEGKLDLAFIQGGLDPRYPDIVHVATISPELIHFLVKPEIQEIKDIRGRIVNMGSKGGGTRVVANQILRYSGLIEGIDYAETHFEDGDLVGMRPARLPDVIVLVSYAPSEVAEFLVKERGYTLLEMPFPPSLATRLGWVADAKILGYMYRVIPPVPKQDIKVIGVNLHLVANRKVDPHAVNQVLQALYGPKVAARFGQRISEADILLPSGFPISDGTELYLTRNDPFLSKATVDKLKAIFGLIMSLASTALVVFKWFRNAPPEPEKPEVNFRDADFKSFLAQVAAIGREVERARAETATAQELHALSDRLSSIRNEAVDLAATASLQDPQVVGTLLISTADTRTEIDAALRRLASPGSAVAAQS